MTNSTDSKNKKFYITTAIAYLNGPPHMGHALEIIQADCIARFYRNLGRDVVFQTGSDEHGVKIYNTVMEKNVELMHFLDQNHKSFVDLYKALNISYDRYVRTTSKVHIKGAQKIWQKLYDRGDIYKAKYNGLYCVGCESYKTDNEIINGKCPDHPNRDLVELKEENYFFKLTNYIDKLLEIYEKDEIQIIPTRRKAEIVAILKSDIPDVSFSRQKKKMPWGIPVPNDEEHVMYVWCDALSNYATNIGYEYDTELFNTIWPADIHLIGKDITKFHAIFWPAMLLSAEIPLYKKLFVHGFLTIEGLKMGKSLGNASDPHVFINQYGTDTFRFYLLKNVPSFDDGSFKEDDLVDIYNSTLANDLGNLLLRVLTFIEKDFNNEIPKSGNLTEIEKEFIEKFDFVDEIKESFDNFQLNKALDRVWEFVRDTNKFVNDTAPWKLKKEDPERYTAVLHVLIEALRVIAIYIKPFTPNISTKILKIIGIDIAQNLNDIKYNPKRTGKVGKKEVLFPKIENNIKEDPLQIFNFKIGKILSAEPHPESDKIFVLSVELGSEKRQICAKIAEFYSINDIIDKTFVVLSNVKKREIAGIISEGMLLGGIDTESNKLKLVEIEGIPGEQIYIEDLEPKIGAIVTGKKLNKTKIKVKDNKIKIGDKFLKTKEDYIQIDLKDGTRLY